MRERLKQEADQPRQFSRGGPEWSTPSHPGESGAEMPLESPFHRERESPAGRQGQIGSLGMRSRKDGRQPAPATALGRRGDPQRRLLNQAPHFVDQLYDAVLPSLPDLQEIGIVFAQVRPQFRLKRILLVTRMSMGGPTATLLFIVASIEIMPTFTASAMLVS